MRSVTHTGPAVDVQVVGNLAYVAAETSGLHIFDVSDPLVPTRLGGLAAGPDMVQVLALRVVGIGYPQPLAWAGANDPILPFNQEEPLQATTASGLPVTLRLETGPATLTNGMARALKESSHCDRTRRVLQGLLCTRDTLRCGSPRPHVFTRCIHPS